MNWELVFNRSSMARLVFFQRVFINVNKKTFKKKHFTSLYGLKLQINIKKDLTIIKYFNSSPWFFKE